MLTSLQNAQIKHVVALQRRKEREDAREFVIEGRRFLEEALRRKAKVKQVYLCPERIQEAWGPLLKSLQERNIPVNEVDEKVLRKMSGTVEPQGILAVVAQPERNWTDVELDDHSVLLIVDGIQDPGNLGTILRTALAAGVKNVCLTPGTVDVYNPKVLRSTMGAVFSLMILHNQSEEDILDFCHSHNLQVVTASISGDSPYQSKIQFPLALVVGNEGNGPSPIFLSRNDREISIPMLNDVESLNVAVATGILLYEIARQRDFL